MIDTHAHVFTAQFSDDFPDAMNRAAAAGITDIVMPAITPGSLREMEALPAGPVRLHCTVGRHPCDVDGSFSRLKEEPLVAELAARPDVVALGETGLDYYWSAEHAALQRESLRMHFDIAKAVDKPVILHNRNSTEDLFSELERAQDGRLRGVWHCFTGTEQEARRAVGLGLLLGIGGVVTYKNGGLAPVLEAIGIDHLVLETDSPYLPPVPHRGKRNEPSYIVHVAEKAAACAGVSVSELVGKTIVNARALFRI